MANSTNRYSNLGYMDVEFDYSTPQSSAVLVASPGVGARILILYTEMSVGNTTTPEPTFSIQEDGTVAKGCTKYINSLGGAAFDEVNYICDENKALTITTNITGNHSVYIQYTILRG